jgi:hypothetical protein
MEPPRLVSLGALLLVSSCVERAGERVPEEARAAESALPETGSVVASSSSPTTPPSEPAQDAPSASSPVPAPAVPASASSAPPSRIPCGNATCSPSQYCVETVIPSGVAPPPGQSGIVSRTKQCSGAIPGSNGAVSCTLSSGHQVSCFAHIPSMPPRNPVP